MLVDKRVTPAITVMVEEGDATPLTVVANGKVIYTEEPDGIRTDDLGREGTDGDDG